MKKNVFAYALLLALGQMIYAIEVPIKYTNMLAAGKALADIIYEVRLDYGKKGRAQADEIIAALKSMGGAAALPNADEIKENLENLHKNVKILGADAGLASTISLLGAFYGGKDAEKVAHLKNILQVCLNSILQLDDEPTLAAPALQKYVAYAATHSLDEVISLMGSDKVDTPENIRAMQRAVAEKSNLSSAQKEKYFQEFSKNMDKMAVMNSVLVASGFMMDSNGKIVQISGKAADKHSAAYLKAEKDSLAVSIYIADAYVKAAGL